MTRRPWKVTAVSLGLMAHPQGAVRARVNRSVIGLRYVTNRLVRRIAARTPGSRRVVPVERKNVGK